MRRNNFLRHTLTALLMAFIIVLSVSCSNTDTSGQKEIDAIMTPGVDVYKVSAPKDIPVVLEYPARAKSISSVTIIARVTGTLQKKFFTEGQLIRKDDLLFKIEPDIYQAGVDNAKAQLEEATAQLNKAERDWKRMKALYDDNATSEQDKDAALSVYEIAQASVHAAKARLRQAEISLQYTDVKATNTGIAGLKLAEVGNVVNPGMPLVTLTQIDPIYSEFSLPDTDVSQRWDELKMSVRPNTDNKFSARLLINDKQYNKKGYVDFFDTTIDETTSSVKARAVFSNPEGQILPGQFVRVEIEGLKRKNVIAAPQKAVIQEPDGMFVYVVEDGKAMRRSVVIGDKTGENFIIEKGLKSGDLVIVNNFFKIKPDSPVTVDTIVVNKGE